MGRSSEWIINKDFSGSVIWSCNWIALGPRRVAVRCGGWSPDYILCTHDAPGGDPLAAAAIM